MEEMTFSFKYRRPKLYWMEKDRIEKLTKFKDVKFMEQDCICA